MHKAKTKRKMDKSTNTAGGINLLSLIEQVNRVWKRICKNWKTLSNKWNIIDIYKILHRIIAKHKLFPSVHKTFTNINFILGSKTILNKLKIFEIIVQVYCLIIIKLS